MSWRYSVIVIMLLVSGSEQSSFHREFVLGGQDSKDVLLSYANLLLGVRSGEEISN